VSAIMKLHFEYMHGQRGMGVLLVLQRTL